MKDPEATAAEAEFSRLVTRGEIARGEVVRDIEANAEERAALARRFGLVALDRLVANLRLRPGPSRDLLRLEGHLSAAATQACVVTLEPLPVVVEQEVSQLYSLEVPEAQSMTEAAGTEEVEIDAEGEDPPEPVGPRGIDLGEAVAEQLALALDPYPRAPEADLEALLEADGHDRAPDGPFAALAALKERD